MSAQLAVAVAVEKFADCGPGKWWFVHHPNGFLIECALQQRAEQIAAEINAGRSNSPDLSLVQARAAEDRPLTSAATSRSPANPADADGHPGIPSSDEREAGQGSLPELGAQSERAVAQIKPRKPLRPHCQSPEDLSKCAGRGREHCHACTKAMGASEAA